MGIKLAAAAAFVAGLLLAASPALLAGRAAADGTMAAPHAAKSGIGR